MWIKELVNLMRAWKESAKRRSLAAKHLCILCFRESSAFIMLSVQRWQFLAAGNILIACAVGLCLCVRSSCASGLRPLQQGPGLSPSFVKRNPSEAYLHCSGMWWHASHIWYTHKGQHHHCCGTVGWIPEILHRMCHHSTKCYPSASPGSSR